MTNTVFCGTSRDGFIARPDGGLDFLVEAADANVDYGFKDFFKSIDALVMGRNTFDAALGFDEWFYGAKPVFVASHRPLPAIRFKDAVVERVGGSPDEIVKQLRKRGFEHVYVDGGNLIQQFLRAGLIDRLVVAHLPILVGQGIPLFGALDRDIHLRHKGTRSFPGGMTQSEYEVAHDRAPKQVPTPRHS